MHMGVYNVCVHKKNIYYLMACLTAESGDGCVADLPVYGVDGHTLYVLVKLCEERVLLDDALAVSAAAAVEAARLESLGCQSDLAAVRADEAAARGRLPSEVDTAASAEVRFAACRVRDIEGYEFACAVRAATAATRHEHRAIGGGVAPFDGSELFLISAMSSKELLSLLAAADYLGAAPVMDLCCAALTDLCRGSSDVEDLLKSPARWEGKGYFYADFPPWRRLCDARTVQGLERAAKAPKLSGATASALLAAAVWMPKQEAARVAARRLAVAGMLLVSSNGFVEARRLPGGAPVRSMAHPDGVPQGSSVVALLDLGAGVVAVCYSANIVAVWDVACGDTAVSFAGRRSVVGPLTAAAAVGDGRIALGYTDGCVSLVGFDVPRVGETHRALGWCGDPVTQIAVLPSAGGGPRIVACTERGRVSVLDADSLNMASTSFERHGRDTAVVPLWDARLLSFDNFGVLEVWDPASGRRVAQAQQRHDGVHPWIVDARALADGGVVVLTVEDGGGGTLSTLGWDGVDLVSRGPEQSLTQEHLEFWNLTATGDPDVLAYVDVKHAVQLLARGPDGAWAPRGDPFRLMSVGCAYNQLLAL